MLREYLHAYDTQLRSEAETPSAVAVTELGPLRLVVLPGGQGFVTYPHLAGADTETLVNWVERVADHYRADPAIDYVKWKTRGHDDAPGLHEALVRNGFRPGETESVMIGELSGLAADVSLPDGVTLRRITSDTDVRAMCAMVAEAFGDMDADRTADALLRRLGRRDGMELWVAESGGRVISAGRLEPVRGTEFAGLWGGATLAEWRGRGIYRALTAAPARARRWSWANASCTAIRPSSPGRSSNAPDSSRSPRPPRTTGSATS